MMMLVSIHTQGTAMELFIYICLFDSLYHVVCVTLETSFDSVSKMANLSKTIMVKIYCNSPLSSRGKTTRKLRTLLKEVRFL